MDEFALAAGANHVMHSLSAAMGPKRKSSLTTVKSHGVPSEGLSALSTSTSKNYTSTSSKNSTSTLRTKSNVHPTAGLGLERGPSPLSWTSTGDDGTGGQHDASEQTGTAASPANHNTGPARRNVGVRFLSTTKLILYSNPVNLLLVFVPVGIAVHFADLPAGVVFAMNAIAIVPLAGLLSHATESVASRLGDTVGALMNVTFGNAVELIIFIIALVQGHVRIVQASLVGSILVNLLLILGMCFLLGGLRYREQIYNSTVTQMSACLLALSVTSLLLPTAFHASFSNEVTADDKVLQVSRGTSVIILVVYFLYLVFQLKSHSYIYASTPVDIVEREAMPGPAAQYFNQSNSEVSTSDSDSDEPPSRRTTSTSRRLRRLASRGKETERSMTLDRATTAGSDTVVATPVSSRSSTARSKHTVEALAHPEISHGEDREERTQAPAVKPRKHRRKWNCFGQKESRDRAKEPAHTRPAPLAAPLTNAARDRTGRFDFAAGPALEAQVDTHQPRSITIRHSHPSAAGIFHLGSTRPLSAGYTSTQAAAAPSGIRRVRSDPHRHNRDPTMRPMIPAAGMYATHHHHRASHPPSSQPPSHNDNPDSEHPTDHTTTTSTTDAPHPTTPVPRTSRTTATILLLLSTALVAICAEFMVSSIDALVATDAPGLSEAFIGLVLLPLVGNAAEHVTAVSVALKNKMDLAIGVAVGSSIQIALFVTPLVVILGWGLGRDMSLFFTLFETVCAFVSAFIVNFLVLDGRSNYLEGALLCAGYVIIAVAAFFYPDVKAANALGGGPGAAR